MPVGTRGVFHAVEASWPVTAGEKRWDVACGRPDADSTEIDPDGRYVCLLCRRRLMEG